MAGFGTNQKIPGAENTPVHGAVARGQKAIGSAVDTVAEWIASISDMPNPTIMSNSFAFVPCLKVPTSVPNAILTPAAYARSNAAYSLRSFTDGGSGILKIGGG